MPTIRISTIASLAFALGACCSPQESAPPKAEPPPRTPPAESPAPAATPATTIVAQIPLARGDQTGIRGERTFVARDADEWAVVWREHGSIAIPPPPTPAVDWTANMVIGAVSASRPTPGYALDIVRVERVGERLRAVLAETKPANGTPQAAVMTRPFVFVSVPKSAEPVEFVRM